MKRRLPNILTLLRMAGATALLWCDVHGTAFWAVYLLCGISDMADGALARKLGAATRTGALLDSIADLVFVACCCVTLLPVLSLPAWLWAWGAVIVAVKAANQAYALARYRKCVFAHTTANKATGLLLFLVLPFSLGSPIPLAVAAAVATFAAVDEGAFLSRQRHPKY